MSCAPQVTVTSEATITLPPPTSTPLPTLHPQFIALQETVVASDERFALNSDGTVKDGAETIPGLHVASNGTMTLTVNGEDILLDPSEVIFDNEDGFQPNGYKWDEENSNWVENKIVIHGIEVKLGEPDENGVSIIEQFVPPDSLTPIKQTKFLDRFNPEVFGFKSDTTRWVVLSGDSGNRIVLQDVNDPANEIAELGSSGLVWDWNKMVDENGESVLLNVGELWEMRGRKPVREGAVRAAIRQIIELSLEEIPSKSGIDTTHYVISQDGQIGVVIAFFVPGQTPETFERSTSGFVIFMDINSKARYLFVINFDWSDTKTTR